MRRPSAAAVLLAACCALSGCAGSGPESGGKPPPPSCKPPAQPTVSFSANVEPFFQVSCAVAGCHAGPVPAQGLDLSTGRAYGDIVDVRSTEVRMLLVKPGAPDDSYLVRKIQNAPGIVLEPMPPPGCPTAPRNGARCPTDSEIAALIQWITECAPNN